ncbi:hypothetical protein HMPREF0973_00197 [Prevotella veroralis F0319]|uniref:Uncharacterized protein n=1 Tax=Prevotella veroralis F0319 TaxID=649761 RepID=C9MKS3_9BACT|nr:hypothetical protein HMPREF0973_00197 [Prevotella veroralis F0319]
MIKIASCSCSLSSGNSFLTIYCIEGNALLHLKRAFLHIKGGVSL